MQTCSRNVSAPRCRLPMSACTSAGKTVRTSSSFPGVSANISTPRRIEGRMMIKEDVDESRLDRIEGILRQKRSEALKRKYVEYERQLASVVDAPSPSLRALRLHAELAVLRRHWKQAAVRWKRFLDAGGTLDSKSALLAVRSLREGATPREAYALLRRVNSELGIEPAR